MPTPALTIRQLASDDAAVLEAMSVMFGRAFDDAEAYTSAPPNRTYLERLLASGHFVALAALKHGSVVGGITAYELQKFEQERSEIYIYDLAVAVKHRREGIATALIKELGEYAKTRGAHVMFVQADADDAPAAALYAKLGSRKEVLHFDIPPA